MSVTLSVVSRYQVHYGLLQNATYEQELSTLTSTVSEYREHMTSLQNELCSVQEELSQTKGYLSIQKAENAALKQSVTNLTSRPGMCYVVVQ